MSLRCPHCGYETVVNASYCPSCGEKMPAPPEPAEAAAEPSGEPEESADETPPETASADAPEAAPSPPQPSVVTTPTSVVPEAEPVTAEPVAPPASTAPAAPTAGPAPPPGAPPRVPQPTAPPAPPAAASAPPGKKSSTWWWVCGGCGCLAIVIGIIAALGGLAFIGKRAVEPVSTEVEGSATAVDEAEGPLASDAGGEQTVGERVPTDHYVVTVGPGWERDQETDEDVLRLLGPEVNGEQLDLRIWVEELAEGVSLADFSDDFLEQYAGIARTEDTYKASLCEEPARRVAFTTDGHDHLIYLSVYKAQGFIIVMIAPEGTMGDEEDTFDQVLDEFAMYE